VRLLLRVRHVAAALPVVAMALAWVGPATPITAAAASCTDSKTCRWTQMDNNDWSPGSGSPYCSPCVRWPNDGTQYHNHYYNPWYGQGSMFEHETDWAMATWSSLQYKSPVFYEANSCNCGYQVGYGAINLGSGLCGRTNLTWSGSTVTGATVYLNTAARYVDGPASGGPCDVRNTLLHETGHVFAEGHSSVASDVMYPSNNNVEAIDQDANNMMLTVYGAYEGCGSCQADVPFDTRSSTPNQTLDAIQSKEKTLVTSVSAPVADRNNMANSDVDNVQYCLPQSPPSPESRCLSHIGPTP